VEADAGTATINNTGNIVGTQFGIAFNNNATGTVTNAAGGSITGANTAVYFNAGGSVSNAGNIGGSGDNWGVGIENAAGSVSNTGSITGVARGVVLFDGGTVTNTGTGSTISATGGGSYAVAIQSASGTVENQNGASIEGVGVGVYMDHGGTVTNGAGSTIKITGTGTGDCNTTGDCAVFVYTGVAGYGGALTLTNAGSIVGNVQMDASADNITTLTAGGSIAGDLNIGSNAASTLTLDGTNTAPQLYSSAVTGTTTFDGALIKSDSGTWVIDSDDLANVAGTVISAGTLQVGNGGTAGSIGNADVADNGTLVFDRSDALTYAGVISGDGNFTKEGDGTLTLTGANTFTGGTTISAGTLQVGNGGASGSIGTGAIVDNGTLAFDRSDDVAFTGGVSGSGLLVQQGSGTLTLTGANTFAGGVAINAGTLAVAGDANLGAASGSLTFNGGAFENTAAFATARTMTFTGTGTLQTDADLTASGTITGAGAMTKTGTGTLTVNGDGSAFTGAADIEAGTLIVGDDGHASATLGGNVAVAQGATIAGIGTIGGMDLSGTLSPGGSIGTFHVTGDAAFESGSTFNVEANPDGKSDQLVVGGQVSIKGGNTLVIAQPGNWAPRTDYTIVTAGKGVAGTFTGVSDDQAFLTPVLSYQPNAVKLSLERNDISFPSVAGTSNEKGAATGADGLGWDSSLYNAVVKLNAMDAQTAFNQASGEFHASQQTARVEDSRYVREAMNQRLRQGDADAEAAPIKGTYLTAWAHAWGHWGTVDGDGNAAKLSDNGDGLLVGVDLPVGAGRVGVAGGASRDSLSINARDSWGRETSTWLGAFAGYDAGAFGFRAGVAYAWDRIPVNRQIAFPSYTDHVSGNASGDTLTGFVEGAWTFHFAHGSVAPFLNVAHARVTTDADTEAGGAAALHTGDASMDTTFALAGARGTWQIAKRLDLHGELGWRHAFGDITPASDERFVSGGAAFAVYGVPVAKNAGLGRIGIGWHQGNTAVNADYEGLAGNGVKDQAAKLSVSVTF
jgi:outer membrane autotransporter protein